MITYNIILMSALYGAAFGINAYMVHVCWQEHDTEWAVVFAVAALVTSVAFAAYVAGLSV